MVFSIKGSFIRALYLKVHEIILKKAVVAPILQFDHFVGLALKRLRLILMAL